jgi:hypothetical protein
MHNQKPEIWDALESKKELTDDITRQLESAIKEFQTQYAHGDADKKKREAPEREPVAV